MFWAESQQRPGSHFADTTPILTKGKEMSGGIYLIQDDGQLVEMTEKPYESEAFLQELLEKYPNLLAGDQIDSNQPRRWLLIAREMGLPGEEEGGDRWSVDHLFLDQDAIPTLVEVKRSEDTRIRREVVGQMLDYAANSVVYWPVETIRAKYEARCEAESRTPDDVLLESLGEDVEPEEFWQKVKTNLQAGRVRLVFVADEIPQELRRVVEFLNSQMDPAEVLAIEIRQYQGKGQRTLVPRVIGQTTKKSGPPGRQWDEPSFFEEVKRRHGQEGYDVCRRILEWARAKRLRIWWGRGKQNGSFFPVYGPTGEGHLTVGVWTSGGVETQFQHIKKEPPFDDDALREELRQRLNEIQGADIPPDGIERRPSISFDLLKAEEPMEHLLKTLDWMVEEIKKVRG